MKNTLSLKACNATICAVIVVPIFAPMMIAVACFSDIIPVFTKPITITSSAVTTIVITMATQGLIVGNGGNSVLFVILGSNIGSCVTALISSIGTSVNARRASVIHLLFNVIGTFYFHGRAACVSLVPAKLVRALVLFARNADRHVPHLFQRGVHLSVNVSFFNWLIASAGDVRKRLSIYTNFMPSSSFSFSSSFLFSHSTDLFIAICPPWKKWRRTTNGSPI